MAGIRPQRMAGASRRLPQKAAAQMDQQGRVNGLLAFIQLDLLS